MGRGKRLGMILAVTILLAVFPVIGAACSPKEKNVETTESDEKSDIKGMPYKMVISPDNNKVTLYDNIYFKNTMESDTKTPEQTIVNFSVVTKEDIEGNDIWRFDNNNETIFAGMAYAGDKLLIPYSYDFHKTVYDGDTMEESRGLELSGGVFVVDDSTGELIRTLEFPDDYVYHPHGVHPASNERIAVWGRINNPEITDSLIQILTQDEIHFIATFTAEGVEALKVFTLGPDTEVTEFHEYNDNTFLLTHKMFFETDEDPDIMTNFSLFQPKDGKFEFVKGWELDDPKIDIATVQQDTEDTLYGMLAGFSDFVRIHLPDYDPEEEGYTVIQDSLGGAESSGSESDDFHFFTTSYNYAEVIKRNRIGIYGADWTFTPEKVDNGFLLMVSQFLDFDTPKVDPPKYDSNVYILDTEGDLVDTVTLPNLEGDYVVGATKDGKTYYTGVLSNTSPEQSHEEWYSFLKPLGVGVWEYSSNE